MLPIFWSKLRISFSLFTCALMNVTICHFISEHCVDYKQKKNLIQIFVLIYCHFIVLLNQLYRLILAVLSTIRKNYIFFYEKKKVLLYLDNYIALKYLFR